MKKLLIVNNNLDTGGIQKSLINLLKAIHDKYDVTLLLFSRSGALLRDVPENVKIITPQRQYRMLGLIKNELKRYPFLFLFKAFLAKYTERFSRRSAIKILGLFQKKIWGYDVVISYSHLPNHKYFANGCGDFVLDKTVCSNKICLIHCDYLHSGTMTMENNAEYLEFDKIACCSESVRERFLQGSGMQPNKVYTLRNFFDLDLGTWAADCPYLYDNDYINLVTVARLSSEKGIDRAIDALCKSKRTDIRYYIIGDGPQKDLLREMVMKYNMHEQVIFLGEQKNPYRYMINADYLLVPSLHEAAPMVFDEAKTLGLSVITTNTTSALEMIKESDGVVCDNHLIGLENALVNVQKIRSKKEVAIDNQMQQEQFDILVNYL